MKKGLPGDTPEPAVIKPSPASLGHSGGVGSPQFARAL